MRTQILYVFAANREEMLALVDSYLGVAFAKRGAIELQRQPRVPSRRTSTAQARRIAADSDAVLSWLGWDHAGGARTLQPSSEPLSAEEYDAAAQDLRSAANKAYIARIESHLAAGGDASCWRVDFEQLPLHGALASAWLSSRLPEAAEAAE